MKDDDIRWYNLRLFIIRLRLNVCTLFSTHASTGWTSSSFWVTWKTDLKITMTSRLVRSRARALVRSRVKQCNSEKTYRHFQTLLTLKRKLGASWTIGLHYVGKIWKWSFISTRVRPSSTLIRRENGAFRRRSSNWRNLKTPTKRFYRVRKTFWERTFSKTRAPR